ncbi:MAG: hypothetical protein D6732_26570 [Methanobacteriota archaeon]|nr:MAG: hypothetical protein D6732_26570 [Euryarchaeota archaeon]
MYAFYRLHFGKDTSMDCVWELELILYDFIFRSGLSSLFFSFKILDYRGWSIVVWIRGMNHIVN